MRKNLVVITVSTASCFLNSGAFAESAVEQSWRSRENLPDAEKISIAPYCPGGFVTIPLQKAPQGKNRFWFNTAKSVTDEQTEFYGDVHIIGEALNTQSDQAVYSSTNETATLTGNVSVLLPEVLLSGNEALVRPDDDYALLYDSQFVMADRDLHGTADELEKQNSSTFVAHDMEFTRCAPMTSQWSVWSHELTVDNDEEVATAWHSTFKIKGVPVMYVPYMSFPLGDQAKSGFLTPTFSSGFNIPYYINLADNYDDTIALNYTQDLGYLALNEFRFLTKEHSGSNTLAYQMTGVEDNEIRRWSVSHNQSGKLASVNYNFDTAWVSDTNADIAFRPGSSDEIDYQKANLTLKQNIYSINNTLAFNYLQPVVDGDEEFEFLTTTWTSSKNNTSLAVQTKFRDEYEEGDREKSTIAVLGDYDYLPKPKITLHHRNTQWPLGFVSSEQLQFGKFSRELPDDLFNGLTASNSFRATDADRYHGAFNLSWPIKGTNWSITPTWKGQATHYNLSNDFSDFEWEDFYESHEFSQFTWRANIDANATVTVAESGSNKYLVKPRLYYGYAPLFKNQNSPTLEGDFIDTFQLFTDSRFSGVDQVGDISRLSAGLTYQWLHNNKPYVTIGAAKGIKLKEERLKETGYGSTVAEPTEDWQPEYSDWIGSTTLRLTENLSFTGRVSYEHDWYEANTYSAELKYRPGDGRVVTLSAVKSDTTDTNSNGDDIDGYSREYIAGAYMPVYRNIALMGYVNFYNFITDAEKRAGKTFSRKDLALEQAMVGIDYDACCWNIRLATLATNSAAFDETDSLFPVETKQTYYFEFTLKGLGGGVGSIESILNRLDFGYSGKIFNYQ